MLSASAASARVNASFSGFGGSGGGGGVSDDAAPAAVNAAVVAASNAIRCPVGNVGTAERMRWNPTGSAAGNWITSLVLIAVRIVTPIIQLFQRIPLPK